MIMKPRPLIPLLIALTAVLIALTLWHAKHLSRLARLPSGLKSQSASNTISSIAPMAVVNARVPVTTAAMASPVKVQPIQLSKTERMKEILSTYNDQPIVFYGQLEDQFSNVVPGATVSFEIRVLNGTDSTIKRGQVVADAVGFFTIEGYHGQDLSVVPQKKGYALASLNGGGNYSLLSSDVQRVHPDARNPIVIKMWKLQGAEPLVNIDRRYKISYTGLPIYFDLLSGKIVPEGGDIKLSVNRQPGTISGRNRLDCGVEVAAVNGGIMNSMGQEPVTYEAPTGGYEPSLTYLFSTNPPGKWVLEFNQGFFLMSRNGQMYSKIGLSFRINESPDGDMYIGFSGIANANGSRNWEGASDTLNNNSQ
jgi:hypothetical protein